ncbi:MAG: DUF1254 domain-containing protein [Fimbriiglobus sp.]
MTKRLTVTCLEDRLCPADVSAPIREPLSFDGVFSSNTASLPANPRPTTEVINEVQTASRGLDDFSVGLRLGVQAYVFGLPLAETERLSRLMTLTYAPTNVFAHNTDLATSDDTDVVAPNNDTVYSTAWLDLSQGPMVLEVPDTDGRYYVMAMYDAYTNNFANPGSRTTGTEAGQFAIVGPNWVGELPAGMRRIDSPTNDVWLIGRTLVDGPADLPNVAAIQEGYRLTPFAIYGQPYTPPTLPRLTPATTLEVARSRLPAEGLAFFQQMGRQLKENPHDLAAEPLVDSFETIGLSVENGFQPDSLPAETLAGMVAGVELGDQLVREIVARGAESAVDGWLLDTGVGRYSEDWFGYAKRAAVTLSGIGALAADEALYARALTSASGSPLDGRSAYTITFPAGETPPVGAFWSVTLYDQNFLLVDNPLDRYSLGSQDAGLRYADDGSLTLIVSATSPGADLEPNWLPAPEGPFNLIMRLYNPAEEIVTGEYQLPGLVTQQPVVTGSAAGSPSVVTVWNAARTNSTQLEPFEASFSGGAEVAVGDLTGDGVPDYVAGAGVGGGPRVVVYDGVTRHRIRDYFAFEESFRGGVDVAVSDLDSDGIAELIVSAGPGGGPRVRVFDGVSGAVEQDFFAFEEGFLGGVSVAASEGQLTIAAGPGGGPRVQTRRGPELSIATDLWVADSADRFGVHLTALGDGTPAVLSADASGFPQLLTGTQVYPLSALYQPRPMPVSADWSGSPLNWPRDRVQAKLDGQDLQALAGRAATIAHKLGFNPEDVTAAGLLEVLLKLRNPPERPDVTNTPALVFIAMALLFLPSILESGPVSGDPELPDDQIDRIIKVRDAIDFIEDQPPY